MRNKKSEIIFEKDHLGTQYYQIISGAIKTNISNDEAREFIHELLFESKF
jgi:CRP-like cAMP-binding protein